MTNEQLKKQISAMETQLAKLKYQIHIMDEFSWNYPEYNTYRIHETVLNSTSNGAEKNALDFGRYRIHKHNAEHSLQLNRETNLIGAIAEQLFPDDTWKADWENNTQLKYYMYKNQGVYDTSATYTTKILGAHYMSEEVAEAVCRVLNNDKVDLGDN